jgi:hypothetical protein
VPNPLINIYIRPDKIYIMGKENNTIIIAMVVGAAIAIVGTVIGYMITKKNETLPAAYIPSPQVPQTEQLPPAQPVQSETQYFPTGTNDDRISRYWYETVPH